MTTNIMTSSAKRKKDIPVSKIMTYFIFIFYLVVLFAPFLVIICTSFMTDYEISNSDFHLLPKEFSLEGYRLIFEMDPNAINGVSSLLIGFVNTMWQTLIPLIGGLFSSSLAAFCYSKFRFPGRNVLFMITVLTMMLPMGAFGFVGYLFYDNIGWVGGSRGILPIIIPGLCGSAGTIFFLRAYFDSALSSDVLEAAKIDGSGYMRILLTIVLPLAKPAIIAQFLFGFVGGYNNYSSALMYLYGEKALWNLQLALSEFIATVSAEGGGYGNAQCATAIIGMTPLILLYIFVQKYFIEGINIGGSKE